jgi:O-Antigen ligase
MKKLLQLLKIIDEYALTTILSIFIFLIPLYPKIPLININYSYISIRAEDFVVAALLLVYAIQLLRRKVHIPAIFIWPFVFFGASILVSYGLGVFVTKTIVYPQIGLLHTLRRFEYMSIFFVAASAVRNTKHFKFLLYSFFASVCLVALYGIAQRFAGFPAVSTMNPEFAKGRILFLTPEARVSSTFAGHYDLASYLVFSLPILWGFYMTLISERISPLTNWLARSVRFAYSSLTSIYHLTLKRLKALAHHIQINDDIVHTERFTSSLPQLLYMSILAILVVGILANAVKTFELPIMTTLGIGILLFSLSFQWARRLTMLVLIFISLFTLILTASRTSFIAYIVTVPALLFFFKRYAYTILIITLSIVLMVTNKSLSDRFSKTIQIRQFLINVETGDTLVVQKSNSKDLPAGSAILRKIDTKKLSASDEKLKQQLLLEASQSATLSGGVASAGSYTEVSAVGVDVSTAIRLQIEWPRAINAFKRNPLFGLGASSITEATDNDYLRWLGEFGLAGFLSFTFILYLIAHFIMVRIPLISAQLQPLYWGALFGMGALMINAGYIDVFEASKVAFTYWFVMGIMVGSLYKFPASSPRHV